MRTNARALGLPVALATAALILTAPAGGHPDDPKIRDDEPAYVGPGWRAGDAGRGVTPKFASSGVALLAWLPVGDFGAQHDDANDCWGYVSPSGREYAILGLSDGTGFVDITIPGEPVILQVFSGPSSLWRDIKVFQHYAYAVTEGAGSNGPAIQVFDLSNIDSGAITQLADVNAGEGTRNTHNVAINTESGYLYRCGGGSNGLRMYDLNENPASPAYVASWPDRYVHDAQIVNITTPKGVREIAICCSGFNGGSVETGVDILDVTDKQNIVALRRFSYSADARYSHQAWLSPDKRYLYLDDELDEGNTVATTTMYVIDLKDLSNPATVGVISNGNTAINHNLYTRDGLIYCANYRSGLRVFDATNPAAPFEVAFFDTYPANDNPNFNGLWSNYPYFPSGTVIGSDIERGLFVWRLTINQLAIALPEGEPAQLDPDGTRVSVEIEPQQGALATGSPSLFYDAGDGFIEAPLTAIGGDTYQAEFPALPCNTRVKWYVQAETTEGITVTLPTGAPSNVYTSIVATNLIAAVDDNFETSSGWTTSVNGATTGQWQRGVPVDDSTWAYDPAADSDGSGQCWLTQNGPGNTDIDGGSVILVSEPFDLAGLENVSIAYDYYLTITVLDGQDKLLVEISTAGPGGPWTEVARHDTSSALWREHLIEQSALDAANVTLSSTTHLRFTAMDIATASIVEAGLDHLRVSSADCTEDMTPGDLDANGVVDLFDLLDLLAAWGACGTPCPPFCSGDIADAGGSACRIDVFDLLELLANWG